MRVQLAIQALSNIVPSGINTYMSLGTFPNDAVGTIEVIEKVYRLFYLFNSTKQRNKNKCQNEFVAADYQIRGVPKVILCGVWVEVDSKGTGPNSVSSPLTLILKVWLSEKKNTGKLY